MLQEKESGAYQSYALSHAHVPKQPSRQLLLFTASQVLSDAALDKKGAENGQLQSDTIYTPFLMRCMLYFYIRNEMVGQEPAAIRMTYDQLRTAAASAFKTRKVSKKQKIAGGDGVAAGGEDSSGELCGQWFDLAVAESAKHV